MLALSGGRQTHVALVDPLEGARGRRGRGQPAKSSPRCTAALIALFVEEGEAVEEGARLAVVEAMKMEHALTAPRAGRIADLTAKVGDTVEQGRRLMVVTSD